MSFPLWDRLRTKRWAQKLYYAISAPMATEEPMRDIKADLDRFTDKWGYGEPSSADADEYLKDAMPIRARFKEALGVAYLRSQARG